MKIILKCILCACKYEVPHWRKDSSKFCSRICSDISKRGENNKICTFCGTFFHMKKSQAERYSRNRGFYCSKKCQYADLKIKSLGELNHQFNLKGHLNSSFRGNELSKKNHQNIDIMVYSPNHPFKNKDNRVLKHRLLVEQNYLLFDIFNFIEIEGCYYLKKELEVHHIDENHSNNAIDNLQILTKSEHRKLHIKNKTIVRNSLGRITGVFKSDKLLENPEEDNQQPIIALNE